ncbi:hypothetical protein V6N12_009929 [Hibiscus sabdariffa]|uniref:Uncharacterized protein n=1 Tax=Hibiscus sabdariffa TaxID=183260 RepID=A0ABR2EC67_9ROSI
MNSGVKPTLGLFLVSKDFSKIKSHEENFSSYFLWISSLKNTLVGEDEAAMMKDDVWCEKDEGFKNKGLYLDEKKTNGEVLKKKTKKKMELLRK